MTNETTYRFLKDYGTMLIDSVYKCNCCAEFYVHPFGCSVPADGPFCQVCDPDTFNEELNPRTKLEDLKIEVNVSNV